MSKTVFEVLNKNTFNFLALIDPDVKNDDILDKLLDLINKHNFAAVLVGGSSIEDDKYNDRLKKIKNTLNKPIILFPGSSNQISKYADAILFTSLLSGRNPKYLIEEQVKGVDLIRKYKLEVIPTGYLILSTKTKTAVEKISETIPLDSSDYNKVLNHCLAAQYFGMKYIFLENGSGADSCINPKLIKYLSDNIDIPIIVGGGITKASQIQEIKYAGANFIVIGTALEKNPNSNFISKLLQ